jgi:type IV fimbrial biogenesis protein FimT
MRFMGSPFVKSSVRGITLLELMIVIGLAAVILAIGAPSFTEFRRNARLTSPVNDFLAATQLARTEAIKRRVPVSICPSISATATNPSCDGDDFTGWIVFVDTDRNCARAAGEPVISGESPINSADVSDSFRVTAVTDGGASCVAIAPTGYVDTTNEAPTLTRLLYCDARGVGAIGDSNISAGRAIALEPNGRARVTRDAAVIADWGIACP